MKNTLVVITLGDLVRYVEHREAEAQKEIVLDHIKPHSAARANRILQSINQKHCGRRKTDSTKPREFRLKATRLNGEDFSNIEQYLIRETRR